MKDWLVSWVEFLWKNLHLWRPSIDDLIIFLWDQNEAFMLITSCPFWPINVFVEETGFTKDSTSVFAFPVMASHYTGETPYGLRMNAQSRCLGDLLDINQQKHIPFGDCFSCVFSFYSLHPPPYTPPPPPPLPLSFQIPGKGNHDRVTLVMKDAWRPGMF